MRTVVCFAKDSEFKSGGLRSAAEYRDLGVREATQGRFVAQVIRVAQRGQMDDFGWHIHHADFRLLFVLKGWLTFRYPGKLGTFTLKAGDAIYQGPDPHIELEHSEDIEVLEVASPADFQTVKCEPAQDQASS